MPADKLGPVVCCVCLFTLCVLVSLSNDLAVCTVSGVSCVFLISLHRDFNLSVVLGLAFPIEDIIVKSLPYIFCLQIGLTWRRNQLMRRAVDNGHIYSVIICAAWWANWCLYTGIVELRLCNLSPPHTALDTEYSITWNQRRTKQVKLEESS